MLDMKRNSTVWIMVRFAILGTALLHCSSSEYVRGLFEVRVLQKCKSPCFQLFCAARCTRWPRVLFDTRL